MTPPMTACSTTVHNTSTQELPPATRNWISNMVSRTANGSLLPDSTSSVALTRGRSRRPCAWARKNTAAASVDATTAPTSSASTQERSRAYFAAGVVNAAVSSTPRVARLIEGAKTLRNVA